MRKLFVGVVSVCLVVGLVAAECFGWAPGRGGGRRTGGRGATGVRSGGISGPSIGGSGNLRNTPTLAPPVSSRRPTSPVRSGGGPRNFGPGSFTPPSSPGQLGEHQRPHPPGSHIGGGPRETPNGRFSGTMSDFQLPSNLSTAYHFTPSQYAPFSPGWYAQHPAAWQLTHPYAGNAVVAATAVGLTSWLVATDAAVSSGGYVSEQTTIIVDETTPAEASEEAADLAQSGAGEVADTTQWKPIGVYAFRSVKNTEATRMLQLAVSPEGIVRGSHYDLISGEVANVSGAVDRNRLRVSWTIGEAGKVVFECNLSELTKPDGQVTAHFPDGQTGAWQISQYQN